MTTRHPSITSLVVVVLVSVATLLMATLGLVNYVSHRESDRRALRHDLVVQADQLAVGLTLPVWNIDRAQIDRVLEALAPHPSIAAVRVDAAAKTQAWTRDDAWRMVRSDGRFPTEGLLEERRAITFGGETIGSVALHATPRFLEEDLRAFRRTIVGSILVVDVLLVVSIYLLLRRAVLKPLMDIERYALAVKSGGVGAVGTIPQSKAFARELENLRSSIEAMVSLLDRRYADVRVSERRYRDIVDFSPLGLYQSRPDGTLIMINHAGAHILGCRDVEEALTLNARDIYADPEERARLIARYVGVGQGQRIEVRLKRRDGSVFWGEMSAHAVKDEAGQPIYFESFVQDITTRKAAEDATRTSEERYRLLFDGNPVPMVVYDLETLEFLAANLAAIAQYGYSREELFALRMPALAVPDDPYLADFLATRFNPRPQVVHVGRRPQRRKDGTVLEVDMTSLSIVLEGRPARLLLCRDMTVEALAQAQQQRLQESLRRTQSMAAMGALVAGVAHEVRNPLFSISATVDALETDLHDRPDFAELAGILRSQVARLTHLMRELLDYGRPAELSLASVQPGEPLRGALRACAALARAKGVELTAQVAPGLPAVCLDTGRMEQVLENLIANAVQHAPPGSSVRLAVHPSDGGDGPAVAFQVEDEGPGISEQDIPRLFEPFFSRRQGGTGLGLPIVQRIVEAHGGVVTVSNGPHGGAVVTVTMPVARPEGAASGSLGL